MKLYAQLLVALILSVSAVTLQAATPVILLIRELRTESGELQALQSQVQRLLNFLEQKTDLRFEVHRYPWNRILANARLGEGIIFGLSKTTERQKEFEFSELLFSNYVWLIQRSEDKFPFVEWADLKGKRLGIIRGVSYGDEFERYRQQWLQVEEDVSSLPARLKKLELKRVDALLWGYWHSDRNVVEAALYRQIARLNLELSGEGRFTIAKKYLQKDDLFFAAVTEKYHTQLEKLNRVLVQHRIEINAILAQ